MRDRTWMVWPGAALALVMLTVGLDAAWGTHAATDTGEIEARPSPTYRRTCLGGTSAGANCKADAECPGSTCQDRNVFSLTVAVLYDAPAADLTAIENMITAMSGTLFDITDGQAEIGVATIHNNALGTTNADLVIHPSTNPVWWQANSGHYRTGGYMEVSIDNVTGAASVADAGQSLAHEFVHLVFDARDEYETRAAGCGAVNGGGACPLAAAGDGTCLMDGNSTELCWGQGNPANATDLTGGNHDPNNVTEQSVCRGNRSCWAQIAWSWPATFTVPTGAPDPAAHGAVVDPTDFIVTSDQVRVVLVLDESGSMDLESPSRIERLRVAATDFIQSAEDGTEVGIVSFSDDALASSGRASVAIAALGANRAAWTNAIDGLAPTAATNIGAGLLRAKEMIVAAGGVTANTYIVLMTDGLNNRPAPSASATADLDAKVADLLAAGIPVYVTCTGGDLGLESQCSEIAAGTNGLYSDAADASGLAEAFVDFHERITGRQAIGSVASVLSKKEGTMQRKFFVDAGSTSASFAVLWQNAGAAATVTLVDPTGRSFDTRTIRQGAYARIASPAAGEWTMAIQPRGADSPFVARAYVHNRMNRLVASIRNPVLRPGEEMYLYAFAKSKGGGLSEPGTKMLAEILRPDGTRETVDLEDNGRDASGHGDDMPGDGIYTGVYTNTGLKGGYRYRVFAEVDGWHQNFDPHRRDPAAQSPRLTREVTVSSAISEPGDVELHPEDDHLTQPGGGPGSGTGTGTPGIPGGNGRILIVILIVLILVLVVVLLLLRCCCRRRRDEDKRQTARDD